MSGLFNTVTGATLFDHNSVSGGANDVEVNNLLVDGDCVILGTLTADIDANAAGTTEGAVQVRSSTGSFTASNNFLFNPTTNGFQLAAAVTATFYGYCRFWGSTIDFSDQLTTTDVLNIFSIPYFKNGLYRPINAQSTAFVNGSTTTGVITVPYWATEICIHLRNANTSTGSTTSPYFILYQSGGVNDVTGLVGSCQHSNGATKVWTGINAYLWGESWSSSLAITGMVILKRGNILHNNSNPPIFSILANTSSAPSGSAITTCAGSLSLNSYSTSNYNANFSLEIKTGAGSTWATAGLYNITYA